MAKIIKNKTEVNPFLLTGEKADLLTEGCFLNKENKKIEKRLSEIKKELDLSAKGTYFNEHGDEVVINFTPRKTDPEPKEIFKYMKAQRIARHFWKCVKIQMSEIKKFIAEEQMKDFQDELEPIKKHTFK